MTRSFSAAASRAGSPMAATSAMAATLNIGDTGRFGIDVALGFDVDVDVVPPRFTLS